MTDTMATAGAFLARPQKTITVPGVGTMRIQTLSGNDVEEARRLATREDGTVNATMQAAAALCFACIEPSFDIASVEQVAGADAERLWHVFNEINAFSSLDPVDPTDDAKGSEVDRKVDEFPATGDAEVAADVGAVGDSA